MDVSTGAWSEIVIEPIVEPRRMSTCVRDKDIIQSLEGVVDLGGLFFEETDHGSLRGKGGKCLAELSSGSQESTVMESVPNSFQASGDNELILREPDVNTVQVNEKVRKLKAFKEQIPVKEVTLELSDKNYLTKRDGTWHAHLKIHRMVQLNGQPAPEAAPPEHDGDINKAVLFERLLGSEVQPVKFSAPSSKTMLMKELHGDHQSISGFRRKSSLKNPIPASWSQYPFLASKPTSPTEKLVYYPFPQKKNPRISEAARKLGLYVTH
ncbi:uncharacterized protein LOC121002583 [Bufo bufo]|uniref:uncharacterized protein LOC121002583 n=1 Tax=Bufo bufo TaxID=8384 RepID=UPI001ABED266|nr:uncharacterized protein LOC121002583 [Bufo bufo]